MVWSSPQSQQRIIMVSSEDARSQWRRTSEAAALVATQLGLPDGWLLSVPTKVFLCVGQKKLLGCCVSEEVAWARRTVLLEPAASSTAEDSGGGVLRCEEAAVPAVCGVRAVWVHGSARRQGIASHLLDVVRCVCCDEGRDPSGLRVWWVASRRPSQTVGAFENSTLHLLKAYG